MNKIFAAVFAAALVIATLANIKPVYAEAVQITDNGMKLNGKLVLADGRKLSEGVVLMVHGTLAHHGMETISNLQTVLVERGYNTLAISLSLGISDRKGMYDCTKPSRHRHTDALDEISIWMNWLKTKDVNNVVLLGHSRGGNQVAWYMSERADPAIKRLVLLAPATWNAKDAEEGYARRHKKELAESVAKAEALVAKGQGETMMKKIGLLYCADADATAASFVSYYKPDTRFDTPSLLARIKTPVQVIAGEKDTVVTGLTERIPALADGKKLRFAVVEDADHFFLDLLAEDVADIIEEFVSPGG